MKTSGALINLAVVALPLLGCVNPHLREGDTLARQGDWDGALDRYRAAYQRNPDDAALVHRIAQATVKVIVLDTQRGFEANAAGHLDQAAADWHKAIELCGPKANPPECSKAFQAIDDNQSAIEYAGDQAAADGRWEDAASVYGALLRVNPELPGIEEKEQGAQKGYAEALRAQASELAHQHLLGAALVTDMKALEHDPLAPGAYQDGRELKRTLSARTKVAVQDLLIDPKGHKGFGKEIVAALRPHLDDYAPYGPTRDPEAQKATFKATVIDYQAHDLTMSGLDKNERKLIANPARVPVNRQVNELKSRLARLEKKPGRKKEIASVKAKLQSARQALAAIPATIPDPSANLWTDTTRTVSATVRFELAEAAFPQPIVLEVTHQASRTARVTPGQKADLPSYDALASEVAAQFRDGATVLDQARARRVEKRLDEGRAALASGHKDEALDAFVEVLFMRGPEGLPDDAAAAIARSLEHGEVRELVAMND